MENKKEICKALLPVLQMTRNLSDLIDLEYKIIENEYNKDETVIAYFENGSIKVANVSMDSGTSMIRDIIKQIV